MFKVCQTLSASYLDALSVGIFLPHVLEDGIHGPPVVEFLLKLVRITWRKKNTTKNLNKVQRSWVPFIFTSSHLRLFTCTGADTQFISPDMIYNFMTRPVYYLREGEENTHTHTHSCCVPEIKFFFYFIL